MSAIEEKIINGVLHYKLNNGWMPYTAKELTEKLRMIVLKYVDTTDLYIEDKPLVQSIFEALL